MKRIDLTTTELKTTDELLMGWYHDNLNKDFNFKLFENWVWRRLNYKFLNRLRVESFKENEFYWASNILKNLKDI